MDSLQLNNFNSSFIVDDKHGHKKLIITELDFAIPEQPIPAELRLEVKDENELVLSSELVAPHVREEAEGKKAYMHREFAIFNHLTVQLTTGAHPQEFAATLYFDLSHDGSL